MGNLSGWDQANVEVQDSMFAEFPDGWHNFLISASEMVRSTMDGTNQVLVDFTAIGGKMDGQTKKVWFSINSDNETVARIANSQLKQVAEAVGVMDMQDTAELLNKTVDIKLYTKGKYQNIGEVRPSSVGGIPAHQSAQAQSDVPAAFR